MDESTLALSQFTLLLCVSAIFVILFATILKVLKETSLFQGNTAVILATCISLLSIIGLSQFVSGGDGLWEVNDSGGGSDNVLEFVLLPYTVLGMTVILLLLLAFIAKIFRTNRVRRNSKETKRGRMEQPYPFESASQACEKTDEESHIKK